MSQSWNPCIAYKRSLTEQPFDKLRTNGCLLILRGIEALDTFPNSVRGELVEPHAKPNRSEFFQMFNRHKQRRYRTCLRTFARRQ